MTATIAAQESSTQFQTDRTYPGLWTITFDNPPINMFVPSTVRERMQSRNSGAKRTIV